MHSTPHTSWPWPSKAWRHHGAAGFDDLDGRRREDVLLDLVFEEERAFVFTVPTTLTAAPSAPEDRRPGLGEWAVVPTGRLETGGNHHHAQATATRGTETWGVELAPAAAVAIDLVAAAPPTERGHREPLR
jgi:hypothetical protein